MRRKIGPMQFLSKVMDILLIFRPMARGLRKNRMMKFGPKILPICSFHEPQYMLELSA